MVEIYRLPVTPFMQNCRIVACPATRQAVIIDPGGEPEKILAKLEQEQLTCTHIWLTHSHLDHCGGVLPLIESLGVPLVAHPGEAMMRSHVKAFAQMYNLPIGEWHDSPEPNREIVGGEELWVGKERAQTLFTPGHSPGHISFYFPESQLVISGDALFAGSIGRTDLPGGDHQQLLHSIREQLLTLPDDTKVLSGHGDDTTVGRERSHNPFLQTA